MQSTATTTQTAHTMCTGFDHINGFKVLAQTNRYNLVIVGRNVMTPVVFQDLCETGLTFMTGEGDTGRDATIKRIKTALQQRSGKTWSVTGSRGSSWGWIKIDAPPARKIWDANGTKKIGKDNFMSRQDRMHLQKLLGLSRRPHFQGDSVPAQSDYYREYIDRAEGRTPSKLGSPNWD